MRWVQLCGSLNILWPCSSLDWNGVELFQCCGHCWVLGQTNTVPWFWFLLLAVSSAVRSGLHLGTGCFEKALDGDFQTWTLRELCSLGKLFNSHCSLFISPKRRVRLRPCGSLLCQRSGILSTQSLAESHRGQHSRRRTPHSGYSSFRSWDATAQH